MKSDLCKTCIHTKVCFKDKNLVGDTFVLGNPLFFDNVKLFGEYEKRKKKGFPCEDYRPDNECDVWIPCSETEDIPDYRVLCCNKYGDEFVGFLEYEDDQWICESECDVLYDPIAWRELPEPWRGEE